MSDCRILVCVGDAVVPPFLAVGAEDYYSNNFSLKSIICGDVEASKPASPHLNLKLFIVKSSIENDYFKQGPEL